MPLNNSFSFFIFYLLIFKNKMPKANIKKNPLRLKDILVFITIFIVICFIIAVVYFFLLFLIAKSIFSIFGAYTKLIFLSIIVILMTLMLIKGIKQRKIPLFQFGANLKYSLGIKSKRKENPFSYWFFIIAYIIFIILTLVKLLRV